MSLSFPYAVVRRATRRTRPFLLLVLALGIATLPLLSAAEARAVERADRALYAPVLPALREAVYQETAALSEYRVDAIFTPASESALATITGTLQLHYVNNTGKSLSKIHFRLYPNLAEYDTGGLTIDDARVGIVSAEVALSVADTLATVTLPGRLGDGDATDVELDFTTTIPTDPTGSYGMFSLDQRSGTYALAHWLPLLAGYDSEIGWELDPPSRLGDPVFTNTALFDVTITAPSTFTLVTTGTQEESSDGGDSTTIHRFTSGPVRDFVMVADEDFQVVSTTAGDTTVNSYFNPGAKSAGKTVLDAGAKSLAVYSELYGDYPYNELDLVEISLGNGAGGVEFPQLVFIGATYYGSNSNEGAPRFLDFVVAHEVAHQWWYALVGNNQYLHAFMDEGLANYSTVVYFEQRYGEAEAEQQINYNLKAGYFSELFAGDDQKVDQPTDDFPSARSYGAIIYGKGALAFAALRAKIGDDAFFSALRDYFDTYEFGIATPDEMKAKFVAASGQDLDEFWRHWFDAAEGRQDYNAADLANLLRAIGR